MIYLVCEDALVHAQAPHSHRRKKYLLLSFLGQLLWLHTTLNLPLAARFLLLGPLLDSRAFRALASARLACARWLQPPPTPG